MRALMWRYGLELIDIPIPPVEDDEVLGKVLIAVFGIIDNAVGTGFLPHKEVVAGSMALIRVIEPGIGQDYIREGELCLVKPRCLSRTHGLDTDGFLSEYGKTKRKCLIKIPQKSKPSIELMLAFEFSYINDVLNTLEGNDVIIIGCNLDAYVLSLNLSNKYNVTVICRDSKIRRYIASTGVNIVKPERVKGEYDAAILASYTLGEGLDVIKLLKDNATIVIPPTHPPYYISSKNIKRLIKIFVPALQSPNYGRPYIDKLSKNLLKDFIAITNELKDVGSLARYFDRVYYSTYGIETT